MPFSQTAQTGFAASAAYDANRPGYPADAISRLLEALEIKGVEGARLVDLAAGTGKFTELVAAQPENFAILAVEPHAGMREQLANKSLKNVEVMEGTSDAMKGIADNSVAAVVTAQAWHWFSNMESLKEIHRVLQSAGVFGMIWNIEDHNAPKGWDIHGGWESTMRDVMWDLDDGLPRFRNEQWKKVFDDQNKGGPLSIYAADPMFGLPIGEASIDTEEWLSKQAIWDRFKTYSQIANLSGERSKEVEKIYWDAINAPGTETDDQGRVAVHGKSVWAWASKIPGEPLQNGGKPDQ